MRSLNFGQFGFIICLVAVLTMVSPAAFQQATSLLQQIRTTDKTIDQEMIKELGADDLGMRKYVMAFLKAGPNREQDQQAAAKLMKGHMDNIVRMASEGKLILAGPFMDKGSIRGIYVFKTEDLEEAKKWTETDPAIKAGTLEMELHPWYGSASLLLVNNLHSRIQKKSFGQ